MSSSEVRLVWGCVRRFNDGRHLLELCSPLLLLVVVAVVVLVVTLVLLPLLLDFFACVMLSDKYRQHQPIHLRQCPGRGKIFNQHAVAQ